MKNGKLFIILAVVLGIGTVFTIVKNNASPSLSAAQKATPDKVEKIDLNSLLPKLSVTECSGTDYDNCIYDSNTFGSATARPILLNDNLDYIYQSADKFVVAENAELDYECIGTKTYFRDSTSEPEISWSSTGGSAPYERVSMEGEIDFSDRKKLDAFQLICLDHDRADDGSWAGMAVWSYFDKDIEVNEAPISGSISMGKDKLVEGEPVSFSVQASDPNGQSVSYEWSNGDTGSSAKYLFDSSGEKKVSVTVSDGYKSVEEEVSFEVEEKNKPPVIGSVEGPDKVKVGEAFTVSIQASDPNGDDLSISWSNGGTGSSAEYVFDSRGQKTISVEVSDGRLSSTETFSLVVEEKSFWEKLRGFFQGLF